MASGRVRLGVAALVAAALAGCGLGAGPASEGTALLTVTRDYGAKRVADTQLGSPPETETALRLLDREAEIETRYGGGFVQAIEGVAGGVEDGRSSDWFFYVNGIESPIGSADRRIAGGDRVWWDYRDWTDVMRVPAVVGSWPEPFLQASATDPDPVVVECAGEAEPCDAARDALRAEGIEVAEGGADASPGPRMLVGPWSEIRIDRSAGQIDSGPAESGVFARFDRKSSGTELVALSERLEDAITIGDGAGLVAALRPGEGSPTWIVTGVDDEGVAAAARALDDATLADHYAVVVGAGTTAVLALPAGSSE